MVSKQQLLEKLSFSLFWSDALKIQHSWMKPTKVIWKEKKKFGRKRVFATDERLIPRKSNGIRSSLSTIKRTQSSIVSNQFDC